MARSTRLEFREDFADVLALCRKVSGTLGVFRNVAEQVSVFLHVGAASGRVGHDGLHVGVLEHIDGLLCETDGGGFLSSMNEQSATASLRLGSDHFTAFGGENAGRCGIHLRKKFALHAAKKQPDAAAFWADGRSDFRDGFLGSEFRKQRFHGPPFLWKQFEQPQAANEGLQSGFLIGEERRAQSAEVIRPGERLIQKMTMTLFRGRTREIAFDLSACGFDKLSVIHAGRAGGHASHAAEAGVEVADPLGSHLCGAFGGELHQIDAPARRIHFLPPQNVGRAHGQAKAAVHALINDGVGGRMMRVKSGRKRIGKRRHETSGQLTVYRP